MFIKIFPPFLNRMIYISENPSEENLNTHFILNNSFHTLVLVIRYTAIHRVQSDGLQMTINFCTFAFDAG
jgi:hypothetical protein